MRTAHATALANGRFELIRELGEGGHGTVYEAYDRELEMRIAIKQLSRLTPDALLRFKREFRTLANLRHENIVRLYELFEQDGRWYFTMELVEGRDFVSFVRDGAAGHGCDEARLRRSLIALCRGLCAIHEAGFVHRDVGAENVRVTADGRLVILDFGLVAPRDVSAWVEETSMQGTVDYIAPEQTEPGPVGPAADWYAVGVLLYEALTGELPFYGSAVDVIMRKRAHPSTPPRERAAAVPADLEQLCMALLSTAPDLRPDGAAISRALGVSLAGLSKVADSDWFLRAELVGREDELRELSDCFDVVVEGAVRLGVIQGDSGMGKSTLMREVAVRAVARHPGAVVLSSVCYERESVPYKAFDSVLDALALHLSALTDDSYARAQPLQYDLLARVFPGLARVPALAGEGLPVPREPSTQRRIVFEGVIALLRAFSQKAPLLICIDDLQWADSDSLALLAAVLEAEAPPRVLFLATTRPESAALVHEAALVALLAKSTVERVKLGALTEQASRHFVERVATSRLATAQIDAIVRESQGHPMFLAELLRLALHPDEASAGSMTLDEAIVRRAHRLAPLARQVLGAIALAGAPISKPVLRSALAIRGEELVAALGDLAEGHWVRVFTAADVECYHDRIREAVSLDLDLETRQRLHAALARALERRCPELGARIALHWLGANQALRAVPWLERAALEAVDALAFQRAAQLYAQLLSLDGQIDGERRDGFRVAKANALAHAGRSAEAAHEYLTALSGASASDTAWLRKKAAQALFQAGRVEQGLDVMRTLFHSRGMMFAETTSFALLQVAWHRALLNFRNYDIAEQEAAPVEGRTRDDLELLFDLGPALGWIDMARGVELQSRHLRLALSARDPKHLALAFSYEAAFSEVSARGRSSAERCIALARKVAEREREPFVAAVIASNAGLVSFFRVELTRARALLAEAEQIYREQCVGASWPLGVVRTNLLTVLFMLGECGEHTRLSGEWMRDAQDRGDQLAYTSLLVLGGGFHRLAIGQGVSVAEEIVETCMQQWPAKPFCARHLGHMIAKANLLRMRRAPQAADYLEERWADVSKSLLARSDFTLASLLPMRAHGLIDRLVTQEGHAREATLSAVDKIVRQLERVQGAAAKQRSSLLRAQVTMLKGDHAAAREALERFTSAGTADSLAVELHAGVYLLGALHGGEHGKQLRERALVWARDRGFPDPYMPLWMTIPAVRVLEDGA
jgi:serine/threonine protein kinase